MRLTFYCVVLVLLLVVARVPVVSLAVLAYLNDKSLFLSFHLILFVLNDSNLNYLSLAL